MLKRILGLCAFAFVAACGSESGFSAQSTASPTGPGLTPPAFVSPSAAETAPSVTPPNVTRPPAIASDFVRTESDPFSTFAADVDTASYDIFRRSLGFGQLPAVAEVRPEEYVNYFAYHYPVPDADGDVPFSISLSASAHVDETRATKLLRVGIQAAKPAENPPANLVFLVDVSGSMAAPNKLPLVQRVLHETLLELQPTDTVSIVTYAADTRVRLAPTMVKTPARIAAVIDALQAGGGTNGASGIELAYEQAQAGFIEGGVNHVILCTDGDFNLGITSPDGLVSLIKQKRQTGVTLTALGFGDRNNDAMMERVSNAGNGTYSVLYNEDQAIAYAHERLVSTMVFVAKDLKIQVEFNPERVYAYRLIGYEDRAVADDQFRNDRVDGGEVGAGHRVTALYELALSQADLPDLGRNVSNGDRAAANVESEIAGSDLVQVRVRWKKPGASTTDAAAETAKSLAEDAIEADAESLDDDARWAVGVSRIAELLKQSPYASRSELPRVEALLVPLAGEDPDRRELVGLLPQLERLVTGRR